MGRNLSDRRSALKIVGGAGATAFALRFSTPAIAQSAPLKVGFMMSYSGTGASLSRNIDNAFRQYVAERSDKLGGRSIEYVTVDDQAEPSKATDNMNKLVDREKVDVVIGAVQSGVQMAMVKIARETGKLMIIPNAGVNAATRAACAPNIFRTSFTNWQLCFPMGQVMADAGHKRVLTISWKYSGGEESAAAFKEGFSKAGGQVTDELWVSFPEVEFQSFLTQIAEKKPDAVFAFFAGGGSVKFVKDYAALGLRKSIPLYGAGALTDGTLVAQGEAADGLKTTLHYADDLDNPADKAFRAAYQKCYNVEPDSYSVQGYDTAALLAIGLDAVKGDTNAKDEMYKAMRAAKIDSPRGPMTMSVANNPIQNVYLREVKNGKNAYVKIAAQALADPGTGCHMA
jgi:branched-chain amino acid transport system substrate-binding protein